MKSGLNTRTGRTGRRTTMEAIMIRKTSFLAVGLGMFLAAGLTATLVTSSQASSPRKVDAETYAKALRVFKRKQCSGCHVPDSSELGEKGPGLKGVYKARGEDWLKKFLANPAELAKTDPRLIELKKTYPDGMPDPELSTEQIDLLLSFLSVDGVEPK